MANSDNPRNGFEFEEQARRWFQRLGLVLQHGFTTDVGVASLKKPHKFDLGSAEPPTLVECKRHTWTRGGNLPSAKLAVLNEAMYYFVAAPSNYRKILFMLKDIRRGETLAACYIRLYSHLIPSGVEVWEYDPRVGEAVCVYN